MPLTLIAIENASSVGMVTSADRDFDGKPHLSPWLKSLFVHPFYRKKRIATLLIERLEHEALCIGCKSLYLMREFFTKRAAGRQLTTSKHRMAQQL